MKQSDSLFVYVTKQNNFSSSTYAKVSDSV